MGDANTEANIVPKPTPFIPQLADGIPQLKRHESFQSESAP
jgi:hypothetical protein